MFFRKYSLHSTSNNDISIPVSLQEHGEVTYVFKLYDCQKAMNLENCKKAVFFAEKPDGNKIANECEIRENQIYLLLTLQMTTSVGLMKGVIILYFSEGNIQFRGVNFDVKYTPQIDSITSTDEFTVLENSIKQIEKIIEEGIETSQGKSAYEIAIENGFEGTEAEWLESLKGEKGADGKDGINGKDGIDGKDGVDGQDGANGTDGRGITSSEINANGELVLTYSDGSAVNVGAVVGTKGEKGDKGDKGEPGTAGADGQDYILTDSDKSEIANIVINEYDSSMMTILGGDSDVS